MHHRVDKINPRASLALYEANPKIIRYSVVAGPKLHPIQMYDLVFKGDERFYNKHLTL